jgi:hypothetical protein
MLRPSPTTASPTLPAVATPRAAAARWRPGTAVLAVAGGLIGGQAVALPIVAVILGVIAVVLGTSSRSACRGAGRGSPWQATTGIVLGAIGIGLGALIFIIGLATAL